MRLSIPHKQEVNNILLQASYTVLVTSLPPKPVLSIEDMFAPNLSPAEEFYALAKKDLLKPCFSMWTYGYKDIGGRTYNFSVPSSMPTRQIACDLNAIACPRLVNYHQILDRLEETHSRVIHVHRTISKTHGLTSAQLLTALPRLADSISWLDDTGLSRNSNRLADMYSKQTLDEVNQLLVLATIQQAANPSTHYHKPFSDRTKLETELKNLCT